MTSAWKSARRSRHGTLMIFVDVATEGSLHADLHFVVTRILRYKSSQHAARRRRVEICTRDRFPSHT